MAKKLRIVVGVSLGAPWVLNALPNPGPTTGYYGLPGDAVSAVDGPVSINASQFLQLFDDFGVYIGTFTLADLPPGFQITAIDQFFGQPCGSSGGGAFACIPLSVSGGATITAWAASFGISLGSDVFDPATMSFAFLSGVWTFTGNIHINAGTTGLRGLLGSADFTSIGSIYGIQNPFDSDSLPLMVFSATYDADESLCPVIGSLSDVQIVDPISGEFSWTLPVGADGVIITLSQTGFDDIVTSVMSPTINYIPSDIFGNVSVSIKPITGFPLCYGPESTLSLAITTPYEPFGPTPITGGIDFGGSPTLQFIGNPSGIYTLIRGQHFDKLYERIPAPATQDVNIPDPFGKIGYIGD